MEYANTQKLKDAEILDEDGLTDEQKRHIETLTDAEIDALIQIKKKLPSFDWPIKTKLPRMF